MAAFYDDVIFPVAISRGSSGGPEFDVEIVTLRSGFEERNLTRAMPTRTYDAAWTVRTKAEVYEILRLYHVVQGPAIGFRLLDWTDYLSCAPDADPAPTDQPLGPGVADGVTAAFQIMKLYEYAGHTHAREIKKPFGTIEVAIDGVAQTGGFSIDAANGIVAFDTPPASGAAITWGGQHHVPVRFDGKLNQAIVDGPARNRIPSIPLREVLL